MTKKMEAKYVMRRKGGEIDDTVTWHMSGLQSNNAARNHFAQVARPGDWLERVVTSTETIFEMGEYDDD